MVYFFFFYSVVRRKTIYEYHRVNFNHQEIRNWTVIYLKALPTCLEMDNCNDCLTKVPEFECKWCPDLHQCSTGTFRFRQDWLEKGCEQRNIKEQNSCPATQTTYTDNFDSHDHPGHVRTDAGLSASVDRNSIAAKGAAGASILDNSKSPSKTPPSLSCLVRVCLCSFVHFLNVT